MYILQSIIAIGICYCFCAGVVTLGRQILQGLADLLGWLMSE